MIWLKDKWRFVPLKSANQKTLVDNNIVHCNTPYAVFYIIKRNSMLLNLYIVLIAQIVYMKNRVYT